MARRLPLGIGSVVLVVLAAAFLGLFGAPEVVPQPPGARWLFSQFLGLRCSVQFASPVLLFSEEGLRGPRAGAVLPGALVHTAGFDPKPALRSQAAQGKLRGIG